MAEGQGDAVLESWTNLLANGALTMQYPTQMANIPKELLHRMQLDITGRVTLEEAPGFQTVWAAHYIKDLKTDLADIAAFFGGRPRRCARAGGPTAT